MLDVRAKEEARYGARIRRAATRAAPAQVHQSTALNAGLQRACAGRAAAVVPLGDGQHQAQPAWVRLQRGPGPVRAERRGKRAYSVVHLAAWRLGIGDRLAKHVPAWRRCMSGRVGAMTRARAQDKETQQRVRDKWWLIRRGVRKHNWRVGGEWGSWSVECLEARPARRRASAWDEELVELRPPRVRGRRRLVEESDEEGS